MALTPLRVTTHLLRGVCADEHALDLAGLIASQVRARSSVKSSSEEVFDYDLPLGTCERGGEEDWHWLATNPVFDLIDSRYPYATDTLYRVVDDAWVHRSAHRPLLAYSHRRGAYRDTMISTPVALTPTLTWFAVGDADKVRSLLSPLKFIGKRRSRGQGRVLSWEIEEVDTPISLWEWGHAGDTGAPMRPLPYECITDFTESVNEVWHGIRPPMWKKELMRALYVGAEEEEFYIPDEWEL